MRPITRRETRRALWAAVTVLLLSSATFTQRASGQSQTGSRSPGSSTRTTAAVPPPSLAIQWIDAVLTHSPGSVDPGTRLLSTWTADTFTLVFPYMVLAGEEAREREVALGCVPKENPVGVDADWAARVAGARRLVGERDREALREAIAQRVTRCGRYQFAISASALQTDIATRETRVTTPAAAPTTRPRESDDRNRTPLLRTMAVVKADDGYFTENVRQAPHWEMARLFVIGARLSPARPSFSREWFAAASAFMLAEANHADLREHLRDARRLFPQDARFVEDEAQLEETFASPQAQAEVASIVETLRRDARVAQQRGSSSNSGISRSSPLASLRPVCDTVSCVDGRPFGIGEPRDHLQAAARLLERAVAQDPTAVEPRIRLGRVQHLLGRYDNAAVTFSSVASMSLDKRQSYLLHLYRGATHQATGRLDAAMGAYLDASALYPSALSANLAIASLLEQHGDSVAATERLRRSTAPASRRGGASPAAGTDTDPLWLSRFGRGIDAERLLSRLWTDLAQGSFR